MESPTKTSRCYVCGWEPYERSFRPMWFVCNGCVDGARAAGVEAELRHLAYIIAREQKR